MKLLSEGEDIASDVVVVGAGPAGIAAAVRAGESGMDVTLVDENVRAGGQIWKGETASPKNPVAGKWLGRLQASDVGVVANAQVVAGCGRRKWLFVERPDGGVNVRFRRLIIANGARELFLPFPGWTLPGIFGVGGLQSLAKSGFDVRGKTIVLAGTGPLLLAAAAHLRHMGAIVPLIAEQAPRRRLLAFGIGLWRHPSKLGQALALQTALARTRQRFGCRVEAADGQRRLEFLHLRQGSHTWREPCDMAGIAFGLTPNIELGALLGCNLSEAGLVVDELQQSSNPEILCAGECTGIGGVDLAIVEGEIAGYVAANQCERARQLFPRRKQAQSFAASLAYTFALRPELKTSPGSDTIVCRCEDVTWGQLKPYSSFREAKLHARCGMGPCQGRVCGSALSFLRGWKMDSVRPPVSPVRIESLIAQNPKGELHSR